MQAAAKILIGQHDFTTFRSSECQAKSPVKTLDNIIITKQRDVIEFQVLARSFLHHQVRNIVGSLAAYRQWKMAGKRLEESSRSTRPPRRRRNCTPAHGALLSKS